VVEHLYRQGERLVKGVQKAVEENHLNGYFQVTGKPCNLIFVTCDQEKQRSQPFRTLFMQEMIKRGVLAPSFVVSFSHSDKDIDHTINAVAESLVTYRKALEDGIERYLIGRPVKPVFRAYN